MKAIYVCGTDTGVGKTILSALLMRYLQNSGVSARYLKPIQTGSDLDTDVVGNLAEIPGERILDPLVSLPLPASVDQASEDAGVEIEMNQIFQELQEVIACHPKDFWILEAAGGMLVPLNSKETQADLIQSVGAPAILATRCGLGTLNHTLLTVEAMGRRQIQLLGVAMIGDSHPKNHESLNKHLGTTPVIDIAWIKKLNPEALNLALAKCDLGVFLK